MAKKHTPAPDHIIRELSQIKHDIELLAGADMRGEAINTTLNAKIVGWWLHITGDTKFYSKQLKSMGCFYSAKNQTWYYKHPAAPNGKSKKHWRTQQVERQCRDCGCKFIGRSTDRICKSCYEVQNKEWEKNNPDPDPTGQKLHLSQPHVEIPEVNQEEVDNLLSQSKQETKPREKRESEKVSTEEAEAALKDFFSN